jgi:hypothetical protein
MPSGELAVKIQVTGIFFRLAVETLTSSQLLGYTPSGWMLFNKGEVGRRHLLRLVSSCVVLCFMRCVLKRSLLTPKNAIHP